MKDNGYVVLDTSAFRKALEKKDDLIDAYNAINNNYDSIVKTLLADNWKGYGAEAFKKDAETVKKNLTGIFDILKTMCDTIEDCLLIFEECDSALGDYNRNPEGMEDAS